MGTGSRLFSDQLDRVAFSAYFLGAVVPLIALAVVVERFALPTLSDRNDALGLIGVVISAALLSLGSFLVLRHRTHDSLDRMDADNRRLSALLRVSSQLATVQHVTEATHCAAEQSLMLADATAVYLFVRGTNGEAPALAAAAGQNAPKLYERLEEKLAPLPRMIFESDRVHLNVLTPDLGEGDDELELTYEGESLEIGFNAAYLLEVLKYMATDEVKMTFQAPERAATIEPVTPDGEDPLDYLCLVMPLRLLD